MASQKSRSEEEAPEGENQISPRSLEAFLLAVLFIGMVGIVCTVGWQH